MISVVGYRLFRASMDLYNTEILMVVHNLTHNPTNTTTWLILIRPTSQDNWPVLVTGFLNSCQLQPYSAILLMANCILKLLIQAFWTQLRLNQEFLLPQWPPASNPIGELYILKKLKLHNSMKNSNLILFQAWGQPRNKNIKRHFAFEKIRMW